MDTSTAAADMAAAATSTAAAAMAAASTATATAAAMGRQFQVLGERGFSAVFPVECVKRRQAAVENFLLTEKEFMRL
jgi:hypothetical protein